MPYDESLAARIRTTLSRRKNVVEKKMFGGVGFLLKGNMLVGVWKDSMIVRLGAEEAGDALRERHVRLFDITGKPMKGWVMVAAEGVEAVNEVTSWVQRAVKFVKTLPSK